MQRSAIILSFPELASTVDSWRLKTVEDAKKGVPPHLTVLFPWKNPPISESDIRVISDICQRSVPFEIVFDNLDYFTGGSVYFSIFDETEINKFSSKIWTKFPETPPYEGTHANPIPHLTVAQGDSDSVGNLHSEILLALQDGFPYTCKVNEVVIIEENHTGAWDVREKIPLG